MTPLGQRTMAAQRVAPATGPRRQRPEHQAQAKLSKQSRTAQKMSKSWMNSATLATTPICFMLLRKSQTNCARARTQTYASCEAVCHSCGISLCCRATVVIASIVQVSQICKVDCGCRCCSAGFEGALMRPTVEQTTVGALNSAFSGICIGSTEIRRWLLFPSARGHTSTRLARSQKTALTTPGMLVPDSQTWTHWHITCKPCNNENSSTSLSSARRWIDECLLWWVSYSTATT